MLQLIQSNRAEHLLDQLAERLTEAARCGPVLAPQTVLVQSQGMRQWLTLETAARRGIVANLQTPMPAAFLWQVCRQVMGAELPAHSAFDKDALCWQIMDLLPGMLDQAGFEPLRDYLGGHRQEQLQRYQLAYRIADVFDQYLVYRPDWILAWEDDSGEELPPEQAWQPLLWRALVQRIRGRAGGAAIHRARVHDQVRKRLLRGDIQAAELPAYVAVFGLSSLPPQQLDLLVALSGVCPVDIYALNPCEHYWGDIVSEKTLARRRAVSASAGESSGEDHYQVGNPLLASWGDQGREFFDLLVERDVPVMDCFATPPAPSLLQAVQRQILQLQGEQGPAPAGDEAVDRFILTATDDSLQVHSCHSAMREVEVLRDQLLAMFAADADLRARDIVVMVPDIAAYAPYVHAVFSQRSEDTPPLRYSISDRSSVAEAPVLRSFLALVDLPRSRFTAPEIIDLLDVPAIARRFGFSPSELNRISHWIESSGIRWAWDGDEKQALGLPPEPANTWQFGLDRLFLGYGMRAADGLYQGILPSDEVDAGSGELLGRLQQFLNRLGYWRRAFEAEQSWPAWCRLLNRCIDDMFDPGEEEALALDGLRQAIAGLLDEDVIGSLEEAIGPALLRSLLQQCLDRPGGSYGFLAGGISFCSLMPMRSIPFRIVCILGMNDQDFPRRQTVPGFDLIATDKPRRGDRNRRSDDRYQMLEALLSARDRLYISYTGRDELDNSDKVASVLLSELLDYCRSNAVCEGDQHLPTAELEQRVLAQLVTAHHLQPFDQRYFQAASLPWFSYAGEYFNAVANRDEVAEPPWGRQSVPADSGSGKRIRLESLQGFIANPCRAFLRQRLGVYLDIVDDELSDTEVLELDGLDRFQLGQDAIGSQLQGVSGEEWERHCRASGVAPLGGPGESALSVIWSRSAAVSQLVEPLVKQPPELLSLALDIGEYRIEGELGPFYGDRLVSWRPGVFRGRQILQQWLRHAVANAGGAAVSSYLVDSEGVRWFAPIDAGEGRQWLQNLLHRYQQGMQRPLPLLPETASAWLASMAKHADTDKARHAAESAWHGNQHVPGEGGDAYFARCFSWPSLLEGDFETLARELVEPALTALEYES